MLALCAGSLMVLAAACAKAPTDEIGSAEAALDAARNAEAPAYAPEAWDQAEAALTAARSEIAAQDAKVALVRSYAKARELLASAETAARGATEAARVERESLKRDIEALVARITTDLDDAAGLLGDLEKCPRRPKGFAQDLELLKGHLQGLRDSVAPIELAAEDGQLHEAQSLATALADETTAFSRELTDAKAKLRC
jgi:primosomal protein N''